MAPMIHGRWSDEETEDAIYADNRNFFKVEIWTSDNQHIERLLYAGNSLDKAREIFGGAVEIDPGCRYTIRQRARVLQRWPERQGGK